MRKQPLLFAIVCIALASFVVFFFRSAHSALETAPSHQPTRFVIAQGEGTDQIVDRLAREGLVVNPIAFKLYLITSGKSGSLKAGSYDFDFPMNAYGLADALVAGRPNERSVRIVEGWTISDIGQYLEQEKIMSSEEFRAALAAVDRTQYPFLENATGFEGYLFPDTYRIFLDERKRELPQKMLATFGKKTDALFADSASRRLSLDKSLVLASIIEREVQSQIDREMVADIFYRRLSVGMPLQADSTVNYITGKKDSQALLRDTAINSPYNTYRYRGLPPGPISNPGLSALKAALNPRPNTYWYFLTTPEGKVIYSTTFEEHVRNKHTYLSKS